MNQYKSFGMPVVPLRYSVPLLVICIAALGILVFVFSLTPTVLFNPPAGAINVTACGILGLNDTYYYLNTSLSFPGVTCFTIIGNNTVFDGENRQNLSSDNTPGTAAVIVLGNNVTVRGLNISSAHTGIKVQKSIGSLITLNLINISDYSNIYVNSSSNITVFQNILYSPSWAGVYLDSVVYSTVRQNFVFGRELVGGNSFGGIGLIASNDNKVLENSVQRTGFALGMQWSNGNVFSGNLVERPVFNGLFVWMAPGARNVLQNNRVVNSTNSAIYLDNVTDILLLNNLVFNTSAPYYDLEANATQANMEIADSYVGRYAFNNSLLKFRNTGNGRINFTQPATVSGANLSADVKLGFNYADVNSSLRPGLNKPAIITFEGLSQNFVNATIFRNGVSCSSDVCTALTGLNAGTVIFSVTSWTNYSVGNGVPPGPSILVNEPDNNDVYTQSSFPVLFNLDLSQNGTAWFSLNNGTTNNTMSTVNNMTFIYNQSALSTGNYTFIAYANFIGTSQTARASVRFNVSDIVVPSGSPYLSIGEPDANDVYYPIDFPVTFVVDLSQSGKAWFSLNSGGSNVTMTNSSNSNTHFTYSQSALSTGNYTFIAYANFTGTTQRDTDSVSFRVAANSTTIQFNNTNSSNLPGAGGSVEFKYVAYWLVVAVLAIAIVVLILLIVRYFSSRTVERNTIPGSIVSQLR